jgi:hypothetical protein
MAFKVESHKAAAHVANQPRDSQLRRGGTKTIFSILTGLFRKPTVIIDLEANRDDLRQSKAMGVAVLLAVPLWALIAIGIARMLR